MVTKFIKAGDVRINMKKVSFYMPVDTTTGATINFYTGKSFTDKYLYTILYFETKQQRDNFIGSLDIDMDVSEAMGVSLVK